ncbi:TonB-dependent receptor domain-containing protein [Klebsiella pneumoniae]|uniref:TonB-dependent receptor domain-containing protein n=1 Tax=Klebsiella pneumoniae TaxID=573 RepID=UPI001D0DD56E|nr:TonB-dependent receptor [Klebsiella pneumoniae]
MASLSVFNTDTKNEIVVAASDNGRTSYQNAGKTRRRGSNWDGISNLRPPGAPNWRGRCWMRPTVKTPAMLFRAAIGSRGLHVIAPMPPLLGAGRGWYAGAEVRYMSDIQVNDANSEQAPAYTVTALNTGYKYVLDNWTVDLYTRVDNLLISATSALLSSTRATDAIMNRRRP